jgi:Tol biopolymer transport system component
MLLYSESSAVGWHLVVQSAAGAGDARKLVVGPEMWPFPSDWTADGRSVVFLEGREEQRSRIGVIDIEPGSEPRWIVEHERGLINWVRLSPDQRWLGYASDRTGRWEVHVTSFPSGEGRWQISTAGGVEPVWSVDGRALYYRAGNGTITRAEIDGRGGVPRVGKVEPLFDVLVDGSRGEWTYDVDAQGRVIVAALSEEEASIPLTAVLNWKSGGRSAER